MNKFKIFARISTIMAQGTTIDETISRPEKTPKNYTKTTTYHLNNFCLTLTNYLVFKFNLFS